MSSLHTLSDLALAEQIASVERRQREGINGHLKARRTQEHLDELKAEQARRTGETIAKFYWLPFPGAYQCVLKNGDGEQLAEGMGATKEAAQEVAERRAKEDSEL